uniref:BED-type domain-containing protein n=1 Tax=Chenopodium quinoa TaxID=63459 RepID=A0A803MNA4_CHEQI
MSNTDNSSVPMDDESEVGNENATTKSTKVGDKRKSEYWNHFWDFRDPVTKKIVQVKCKYCEKMLTGNTNNGTSSLKKHLGACSKYPPNVDKKQKLISVYKSPESDATIVSNWKFDETACRLGLARMVIVDEQPFSIVEREDGLSSVKSSIARIRAAVRYVRSSPSRAKLFAHSSMLVKVSCKGSVCLDVATRWNSTFLMLETALKFEKAFNRFAEDDPDFSRELKDGVPTQEDWKLFNHYDAIIASSSSKNNRNINVANVDNGSENLSSSNSEQMKKFYDDFDEEESDFIVEKSELDYYLEEARERRVEGEMFDILGWWKEKSDKYKVLSTLAKDILAIPISTVSSESAFSTSGRILDQFRSSLGPNMVEALVCTQDWLRASNVCIDIERFLEDVQKYEEELDGSDTGITQVNEFVGNN